MAKRDSWFIILTALLLMPATGWTDCTLSSSPSGCAFQVNATIQNGCLVSGGSGTAEFGTLQFGTYPSQSTAIATATLIGSTVFQLNCTPGITMTISIDGGQHYSGARRVQQGSHTLVYQLFRDAARQIAYGVNQAYPVSLGSGSTNIVLPIYGQLNLPGAATPGVYTDTLTVVLSW